MGSEPLLLFAFDSFAPTHLTSGSWRNASDKGADYADLQYWIKTAHLLENGGFDGLFFADTLSYHEVHDGKPDEAFRDAAQFPIGDPMLLVSALAAVTNKLSFGITTSVSYDPPYAMARRFSTLDHLAQGRIGWNVVTSYAETAARNLGQKQQLKHDERYDRADEYMDVLYKLWESSFEKDAIVNDRVEGTFIDPQRVHPISHEGHYFSVPGAHLLHPSPQRTPFLVVAGSSPKGLQFTGRHAEASFINTTTPELARGLVNKIRSSAEDHGRTADSVKVIGLMPVIVGETDEAAEEEYRNCLERASEAGILARFSGWTGIDFSTVDRHEPLRSVPTKGVQSAIDMFSSADPDREWTLQQVIDFLAVGATGPVIIGSPRTVAEKIREWRDVGEIDGINLSYATKPHSWETFIQLAVPELRKQGLLKPAEQSTGVPVTLREKVFRSDAYAPAGHPAAKYRR